MEKCVEKGGRKGSNVWNDGREGGRRRTGYRVEEGKIYRKMEEEKGRMYGSMQEEEKEFMEKNGRRNVLKEEGSAEEKTF